MGLCRRVQCQAHAEVARTANKNMHDDPHPEKYADGGLPMIASDMPEGRSFVAIALACEGGLGLIALAIGYWLARPPLTQIEWRAAAVGYGLLATAPMLCGLWLITRYPYGPLRALDATVQQLLVPLFRGCSVWELLLISAAAGLGEELLFRGVIQAGAEQYFASPWMALAMAAVLFGLAHPISVTYAILAGLIGAYLGWLALATENLLVPVVAHGAYDFAALLYLLQRDELHPAPGNAPDS